MANSSRLKAIETALAAAIDAGTDSTVTVTRGGPGEGLTRESVWIGDVRFGEQAAALSPQSPRRQTITFELWVWIQKEGNDFPTLRDRCYDVGDQVEKALHANMALAGAADFGQITGGEVGTGMESQSRIAVMQMDATVVARRD